MSKPKSKFTDEQKAHAVTKGGNLPAPKPLPDVIPIREGDATALDLRLKQQAELQPKLAAVQQSIDKILADIARDAGVDVQDIAANYQLANGELVRAKAG